MSLLIKIEFPNLPQFMSALAKAPTIVTKHINSAINKSIYEVKRSAQSVTPVDTGKLRATWRETFRDFFGELQPMAESPRGHLYAKWVHEGHQSYAGVPFLQQGVDTSMPVIQLIFERSLNNALTEIASMSRG